MSDAASRLALVWVKAFIACRDTDFTRMIADFDQQWGGLPWDVDWQTITLSAFLSWADTWSTLDSTYPLMRLHAVKGLASTLPDRIDLPEDLVRELGTINLHQHRPALAASWWYLQRTSAFDRCVSEMTTDACSHRDILRATLMVTNDFHAMLIGRDLHVVCNTLVPQLPASVFVIGGGARAAYNSICRSELPSSSIIDCTSLASTLRNHLPFEMLSAVFPVELSCFDVEHMLCEFRRYNDAVSAMDAGKRPRRTRDLDGIGTRRHLRLHRLQQCAALLHLSLRIPSPEIDVHSAGSSAEPQGSQAEGHLDNVVLPEWANLEIGVLADKCRVRLRAFLDSNGLSSCKIQTHGGTALSRAVYFRAKCPCTQERCTSTFHARAATTGHSAMRPGQFILYVTGVHPDNPTSESTIHASAMPDEEIDFSSISTRRGFRNPSGTMCHLNAVLQVLFTDRDLSAALRSADTCPAHIKGRCFACALKTLELMSRDPLDRTPLHAVTLFDYLRTKGMDPLHQQDASETLAHALRSDSADCSLWKSLSEATRFSYITANHRVGICKCKTQAERDQSTSYVPTMDTLLHLEVPFRQDLLLLPEHRLSLQSILDQRWSGTQFRAGGVGQGGAHCSTCGEQNTLCASKDKLLSTSDTLLIVLKRYVFDSQSHRSSKSTVCINLDEDLLVGDASLSLQSVIVHIGSTIRSGHYLSYRRCETDRSKWSVYNDQSVQHGIDLPATVSRDCYVLLYKVTGRESTVIDLEQLRLPGVTGPHTITVLDCTLIHSDPC